MSPVPQLDSNLSRPTFQLLTVLIVLVLSDLFLTGGEGPARFPALVAITEMRPLVVGTIKSGRPRYNNQKLGRERLHNK